MPAAAPQALPTTLTRHKSQLEALLQRMGALDEPPGAQALLQQHALHALEAAASNLHQQRGGLASQQPSSSQRAESHASAWIQRMASHAGAAALHQELQEHHQRLHRDHHQQQLHEHQQDLAGSAPQEASTGHSLETGQQDELGDRPSLSPAAGHLLSLRSTTGQLQATRRLAWSPSASAGGGSRGDAHIVHPMHGSQRRPGQPGKLRSQQHLSGPRYKTGGLHCWSLIALCLSWLQCLRAVRTFLPNLHLSTWCFVDMRSEVPCNKQPASLRAPAQPPLSGGEADSQLLSCAVQVCMPFLAMKSGSFWGGRFEESSRRWTRKHAGVVLWKL